MPFFTVDPTYPYYPYVHAMAVSGSKSKSLCYEAVKNAFTHIMTDSEFSLSTPRALPEMAYGAVDIHMFVLYKPDTSPCNCYLQVYKHS